MLARDLPENVAVVTHGGPINIVHHILKGIEWTNRNSFFPTTATSIHEVSYVNGEWRLTVENDARHLVLSSLFRLRGGGWSLPGSGRRGRYS
jgi:broad specificity phosphatase PhoE